MPNSVRALLLSAAIAGGVLREVDVTDGRTCWDGQFDDATLATLLSHDQQSPVEPDAVRLQVIANPHKANPDAPPRTLTVRDRPDGIGIALAWSEPLTWPTPVFAPANRVASQLANWFSFTSYAACQLPIRGNALFLAIDDDYAATNLPTQLYELAAEVAGYEQRGCLTRYPDFIAGKRPRRGDQVWWQGALREVLQVQRGGSYLHLQLGYDLTDWVTRPRSGWVILPKDPA
ncbi:hypothetical protein ACFV1N_46915 [Streptosporangium canum]|uniref:hypothetical protein n=1 Tax=Streptosporangium canum TaxID=324952 RepID=UPI003698E045